MKDEVITFRVDKELKKKLEELCKRERKKKSEIIRELLEAVVK